MVVMSAMCIQMYSVSLEVVEGFGRFLCLCGIIIYVSLSFTFFLYIVEFLGFHHSLIFVLQSTLSPLIDFSC